MDAVAKWISGLVGYNVPELYVILGGVALTLVSLWWVEGLSRWIVIIVIRIFRLLGRHGPEGKELAARVLAAAGRGDIGLDESILDSKFRFAFDDIDYQPGRRVLELTQDKAERADFSNAGLVVLEVGRALQHESGSPLVFIRKVLAKPVGFAGFAWIWPGVGANVVPLWLPADKGALVAEILYTVTAILLGLVLLYTLLRIPLELDAARRGVVAMEDAGVFTLGESVTIQIFLAIILCITLATTFVIGLNIFRSMAHK